MQAAKPPFGAGLRGCDTAKALPKVAFEAYPAPPVYRKRPVRMVVYETHGPLQRSS